MTEWQQVNIRVQGDVKDRFERIVQIESERAGTRLSQSVVFSLIVKDRLQAEAKR